MEANKHFEALLEFKQKCGWYLALNFLQNSVLPKLSVKRQLIVPFIPLQVLVHPVPRELPR